MGMRAPQGSAGSDPVPAPGDCPRCRCHSRDPGHNAVQGQALGLAGSTPFPPSAQGSLITPYPFCFSCLGDRMNELETRASKQGWTTGAQGRMRTGTDSNRGRTSELCACLHHRAWSGAPDRHQEAMNPTKAHAVNVSNSHEFLQEGSWQSQEPLWLQDKLLAYRCTH